MTKPDEARDVIAPQMIEAWAGVDRDRTLLKGTLFCLPEDAPKNLLPGGYFYEKFAAILAALDQAGYEVVKKMPPARKYEFPFTDADLED